VGFPLGLARNGSTRIWLQRKAVGALMNVLIASTAAVTALTAGFLAQEQWPDQRTWGAAALKMFALWCLSFLPGWLYVRFLGMRAKALWNEYVLNLHRLGWDEASHLPAPLVASDVRISAENGDLRSPTETIYQQKFEAYYGRQPIRAATGPDPTAAPTDGRTSNDYVVSSESLFPVFLATSVFAVGWAAVLWDTRFVTNPSGAWDVLKYGFLGAYAFVFGMLIRRFFQSDLRPSAYASAVFRIILVLLVVVVLLQVISTDAAGAGPVLAGAFLVGFFPLVGLQVLQRLTSKVLRRLVPPITPEYPLDQLDGLNLWYEARLAEEGVEDMQNLTTMNLVDVILHTRVPAGRLVDWIDQAFLLIHLDRTDRGELTQARRAQPAPHSDEDAALSGAAARVALRRVGIRTATDLLKVFSVERDRPGRPAPAREYCRPDDVDRLPIPETQLRILVRALAAESALAPVWNWQENGVMVRRASSGAPQPVTSRESRVAGPTQQRHASARLSALLLASVGSLWRDEERRTRSTAEGRPASDPT
jgi:hypothetical protein